MEALTAVASEAAHINGTDSVPSKPVNGGGEQTEEYEPVGSLEAEEQGGPRMPGAGQEAAALKGPVDEEKEHPTSAGQAVTMNGGGVGDAAMAAVDDRLDTNELAHTNGDLLNDAPAEDREGQAEVDYGRVASLTGEEGRERAPEMSFDVDQPARLDSKPESAAQGDAEAQRTEAVEPAPGHDEAPVPAGQPDLSEPVPADPVASVSAEAQPTAESSSLPSQPPAESEAPPASMDALPDAPAPLPSQLVNHTAPVNDMQFEEPATSIPSEEKLPQPTTQAGEPPAAYDPSLAEGAAIPPTHPEAVAPDSISPSLQKRPFEPDNSQESKPYQGDVTEPVQKRQRTSQDGSGEEDGSAVPAEQEQPQTAAGQGQGDMSMIDQSLDYQQDDSAIADDSYSFDPVQGQLPPHPHEHGQEPKQEYSPNASLQQDSQLAQSPSQQEAPPSQPPKPAEPIPKEQTKYALAILRTLKKKSEAGPFLQPVDPVALQIPHYTNVIKNPMDLGTVESKLQKNVYTDVEQFYADMRQIWDNCYTFNGLENPISAWAKTLSAIFEKQAAKMPTIQSIAAAQAQKRSQSPSAAQKQQAQAQAAAANAAKKARRASTTNAPKMASQAKPHEYDDYGGQVPPPRQPGPAKSTKKKNSLGGAGAAPSGQQMQQRQPYAQQQMMGPSPAAVAALKAEQLKFCKEVMKEMYKKQHNSFAYPFYDPVDYVALGIPDYPKIIRRPIDLGSMKRKLDSNQYRDHLSFEADFKLLINNCFTYNPPMTPVHKMGEQLQAVFYQKWQELPQQLPQQEWGYSNGNGGGYYNNEEDNNFDNEQISLMQRQLELLTGNLEMLRAKSQLKSQQHRGGPMGGYGGPMGGMGMQMSPPMGGHMGLHQQPMMMQPPQQSPQHMLPPAPAPQARAPRPVAPPKPKAPKRKSDTTYTPIASTSSAPKPRTTKRSSQARDENWVPPARNAPATSDYEEEEPEANVTFDMKRELAEKIQEFDGPKLDKVVEIIRNSAPELLGDDNKEIELDIDMLDQRTLLKLYEYVVHPVGRGRQLKPKKNKVKGRNRGVDEVAEEERINALQAQLDAMEHSVVQAGGNPQQVMAGAADLQGQVAAPNAGRGDVASSSSEDEDDDGSDSESDGFAPEQ